jgi:hypothetical protein
MYKNVSRFSQSASISHTQVYVNPRAVKAAGSRKKRGPLIDEMREKPQYQCVSKANRKQFKTGKILRVKR